MAHAKGTTRLPPTRTRRWTVRSAWVPRVPCAPLIIAACLLSGLAGCRADRAQPAWRAQSEASCSECCGARCPPCGTYEPTVWSPWNSGPMAVRCGAGESCTEPDPDWLRDLPKPRPGGGVHTQPELIPAPPARSENSSRAAPGLGFELQRPASRPLVPSGAPPAAHSPNNAADSAGGGGAPAQWVGEGFQLQRPAAQVPRGTAAEGAGDTSKPALKGLELPPDRRQPPRINGDDGALTLPVPSQALLGVATK